MESMKSALMAPTKRVGDVESEVDSRWRQLGDPFPIHRQCFQRGEPSHSRLVKSFHKKPLVADDLVTLLISG